MKGPYTKKIIFLYANIRVKNEMKQTLPLTTDLETNCQR